MPTNPKPECSPGALCGVADCSRCLTYRVYAIPNADIHEEDYTAAHIVIDRALRDREARARKDGAASALGLLDKLRCDGTDKQALDHVLRRMQDLFGPFHLQVRAALTAREARAREDGAAEVRDHALKMIDLGRPDCTCRCDWTGMRAAIEFGVGLAKLTEADMEYAKTLRPTLTTPEPAPRED